MTVSLCMIVKNEENVLARCLDSFKELVDEIVIVDTGSTDRTKEIAARYTEKLYDFVWISDFAAARNFAFSKCSGDYIYSADADELIDAENVEKFKALMQVMEPEVEIVQMWYVNRHAYQTTENFEKDLRPKLFKRQRSFVWIDPVHESVRLEPVVFDSEIEIQHWPESQHSARDFGVFQKAAAEGKTLSKKLLHMYAMELFLAGQERDFAAAVPVFEAAIYENWGSITMMPGILKRRAYGLSMRCRRPSRSCRRQQENEFLWRCWRTAMRNWRGSIRRWRRSF